MSSVRPVPSLRPTTADLRALLARHRPPCISLYEPTHRSYPRSGEEDPVRYRNLLRQAELSLRRKYLAREFRPVLDKLQRFVEDPDFWIHAADGLAVFGSPDELRVFKLPEPVPEMLSIADSFQIKPLVRILQRNERYQILALTLAEAKMYEGTRDAIDRLDLKGIPSTLEEALGAELTEPFLKVTRNYGGGASGQPMYHGQGGRKGATHASHAGGREAERRPDRERAARAQRDERNLDRDRFFRVIDKVILERFSNRSRMPLLLAALPEHQAHFRKISHNPLLLDRGIELNPDALSPEQLHEAAWSVMEPYFGERLGHIISDYGQARAHGRASDNANEVAEALAQGRVATLLVEADRRVPGRVDAVAGKVTYADPQAVSDDPALEDVLDDLAEAVLRTRGEVIVIPAEKMPTKTGLAAIYRF